MGMCQIRRHLNVGVVFSSAVAAESSGRLL